MHGVIAEQKVGGICGLGRLIVAATLLAAGALTLAPANGERRAVMLTVADVIGPATSDYIQRGLDAAVASGADLVIIKIDTPGGLDTAMRDIIRAILAAPVPVATFVSPSGARAASAGTYILYASHIAAMAPATNLGAATPIQIGGLPGLPDDLKPPKPQGEEDDKADTDEGDKPAPSGMDAMNKKLVNDAVAYIRGLATMRGRNADWAETAVREGARLRYSMLCTAVWCRWTVATSPSTLRVWCLSCARRTGAPRFFPSLRIRTSPTC